VYGVTDNKESIVMTNGFTPTQQAILNVLGDGRLHSRGELLLCLGDELADLSSLQNQISRMRKILEPQGYLIDCVLRNGIQYRWHPHLKRDTE